MKKICLILCFSLLCALCGCGRPGHEPTEVAKPAIYLYPDSSEAACSDTEPAAPEKPAIYLYPEETEITEEKPMLYLEPAQKTQVTVKLFFDGTLTCTYPAYRDGWTVWAAPDGTLTDETGREYNYLFWEGVSDTEYDMRRGFVVAGADTADFLEKTLAELGLNDREAGDFITYWLPRMQDNPYNLIAFQQEAYTETAKLEITPEPDSLLRVFMAFAPLEAPISVPEQALPSFERKGFAAVEWGGAEVSYRP